MATEIPETGVRSSANGHLFSIHPKIGDQVVPLCASALFAGLTAQECKEIVACGRARTFARDELLFAQGQPICSLIFLQSGSVKHTQLSESGAEVLLWMSGSGEAVNLQPETTSCNHSCSARATERCIAVAWDYSRLQVLLYQYPQIGKNINQILASRLEELEERFREIATEKVAKRLALTLLRLMKHIGKASPEGTQISLSREELSQMTGTTLFTISRILSRWAEQGVVVPRREAVLVRDRKKLEAIC